ncbi:hypothetical protein [Clostridium sp. BJN0001]|uniref:hypothetical protein n=1 Tax=Clostridium sp. BJN0001 TaxID=2930219 RepID=UPI001FD294B3|nr:hypothetical protein [Clostridium sp. BJN0001]
MKRNNIKKNVAKTMSMALASAGLMGLFNSAPVSAATLHTYGRMCEPIRATDSSYEDRVVFDFGTKEVNCAEGGVPNEAHYNYLPHIEGYYTTDVEGIASHNWVETKNGYATYYGDYGECLLTELLRQISQVGTTHAWETPIWKKNEKGEWIATFMDKAKVTGWVAYGGTWYYLIDGVMQTNRWFTIGNSKYYIGADGRMKIGWAKVDNSWYLFTPMKEWTTPFINEEGEQDYQDHNNIQELGIMKTGWVDTYKITGLFGNSHSTDFMQYQEDLYNSTQTHKWYYLGTDGKMRTGWQKINGAWYYFYSNGEMASNCNISGYTLGADGSLQ